MTLEVGLIMVLCLLLSWMWQEVGGGGSLCPSSDRGPQIVGTLYGHLPKGGVRLSAKGMQTPALSNSLCEGDEKNWGDQGFLEEDAGAVHFPSPTMGAGRWSTSCLVTWSRRNYSEPDGCSLESLTQGPSVWVPACKGAGWRERAALGRNGAPLGVRHRSRVSPDAALLLLHEGTALEVSSWGVTGIQLRQKGSRGNRIVKSHSMEQPSKAAILAGFSPIHILKIKMFIPAAGICSLQDAANLGWISLRWRPECSIVHQALFVYD